MSALKKPVPFGKYFLLERINVGGMAEVFKAKTFGVEGFERLVAVKRILPNIAEDEEFIAMFIDEAKIAVQLQHANIAQIFDLGKVDDSYFIAMEYVHGRTCARSSTACASQGRCAMPIAQACFVIDAGLRGARLRAQQARRPGARAEPRPPRHLAAERPDRYEGEVKLIDFGIAKAAGKASKTQAGILKGKFGYMSPEQVRGLPLDRRSDIFALGIVLYELLTGERLFVGESDFSTLEKVRNVEILPPSSYNQKIPQELERIVLKALAQGRRGPLPERDRPARRPAGVPVHGRRVLLAQGSRGVDEEDVRDGDRGGQRQAGAVPPGRAAGAPSAEVSRRAAVAGLPGAAAGRSRRRRAAKGGARPRSSRPSRPPRPPRGQQAMGWDDEELDTQIFDKEEVKPRRGRRLFFEDDDRTVANEPAPDILEQARPPELLLRRSRSMLTPDRARARTVKMTPPPLARPLPPPPAARRPTLVGVAARGQAPDADGRRRCAVASAAGSAARPRRRACGVRDRPARRRTCRRAALRRRRCAGRRRRAAAAAVPRAARRRRSAPGASTPCRSRQPAGRGCRACWGSWRSAPSRRRSTGTTAPSSRAGSS